MTLQGQLEGLHRRPRRREWQTDGVVKPVIGGGALHLEVEGASNHLTQNGRIRIQDQRPGDRRGIQRPNQAVAIAAMLAAEVKHVRDQGVCNGASVQNIEADKTLDLHARPGGDACRQRIEQQTVQSAGGVPGKKHSTQRRGSGQLAQRDRTPARQGQVGITQPRQGEGFVDCVWDQAAYDHGCHGSKLEHSDRRRFDSRQPQPEPDLILHHGCQEYTSFGPALAPIRVRGATD